MMERGSSLILKLCRFHYLTGYNPTQTNSRPNCFLINLLTVPLKYYFHNQHCVLSYLNIFREMHISPCVTKKRGKLDKIRAKEESANLKKETTCCR